MSSDPPARCYVWTWLPGTTEPVVAGVLERVGHGEAYAFAYGRSYLGREDAVALEPESLPLRRGTQTGLPAVPGCLRDAGPDAWGRRVIEVGLAGERSGELTELDYLLLSGSDRIGALDFQRGATEHVPRGADEASLEELQSVADLVERGESVPAPLAQALFHGTSIGGARPKALLSGVDRRLIAKFSSSADTRPVLKGEFVAMRLAALAGLDVAPVELVRMSGRDVLLVERFDRVLGAGGWRRKAMLSALTLSGLDEMRARYVSYADLAESLRHRSRAPTRDVRELFGRLVFNILCSNTDDHARNHSTFWDGERLELTPAYDVCPQTRGSHEVNQAMIVHGERREARLALAFEAAPSFGLAREEAERVVTRQRRTIEARWDDVCDEARLGRRERERLRREHFLPAFAFE